MFTNPKAFSGFAVDDIARARTFYAETLGLKVSDIADDTARNMGLRIAWFKDPAGNILSVAP